MDNFEFFAIQSSTDAYEGDWSNVTISSRLNDLIFSCRLLRLSNPALHYRIVRISLNSEVVVSHDSKLLGDEA